MSSPVADFSGAVAEARNLLDGRLVTVLTGAGISTDAGIPDFRGPNGVWTRNPGAERLATLHHYLEDEAVRRTAWRSRLESPVWSARPTEAHRALVRLEAAGRLHTLVTQNTDGLHALAGTSAERLVEIHGSVHTCVCWQCGDRQPTEGVLERVREGEDDPRCRRPRADDGRPCGGILKTATVSFGQSIDPDDLERAHGGVMAADALLAIGSTLGVQPVASMVPLAARLGKPVVIVNGGPTACDELADVLVPGSISEVVPRLLGS